MRNHNVGCLEGERGRCWIRFGGVLLATLALSACLLPQDKSPPRQDYLLEVTSFASPPARRASDKILLVAMPKAAPGFDSNRIAYSREPLKLDYLWAALCMVGAVYFIFRG